MPKTVRDTGNTVMTQTLSLHGAHLHFSGVRHNKTK